MPSLASLYDTGGKPAPDSHHGPQSPGCAVWNGCCPLLFRRTNSVTSSCDLCGLLSIPSALPPPLFSLLGSDFKSKETCGRNDEVVAEEICSASERAWFPQARSSRKDQRRNKPSNSRFGKSEFQAFYCLSIVETWAMKMPHQQNKDTLHENRAEKGNLSGSCAHLPAPTYDPSWSSWRQAKSRITGKLLRHMPSCWKDNEENSVRAI